jgi:hypothetical protein
MGIAIAEYNSVATNGRPHRNVPSSIPAYLYQPNFSEPEPNWHFQISYFFTSKHGFDNLQDLYVFLNRVVLPNIIRTNRQQLQQLYLARPQAPLQCVLRYDHWGLTPLGKLRLANIHVVPPPRRPGQPQPVALNATWNNQVRSIFRSYLTPDPAQFYNWLCSASQQIPAQIQHQHSELDDYLSIPESIIRSWTFGMLYQHTIRLLNIFWFISEANHRLERYALNNWIGVETTF